MMQKDISLNQNLITIRGIAATAIFACSPFMYGNLFGRGIFLYLAFFFIFSLIVYALSRNAGYISLDIKTSEKLFCACMAWECFTYLWSPATSLDSMFSISKIFLLFIVVSTCEYSYVEKSLMLRATVVISLVAIYSMLTGNKMFSTEGVDAMRVSFSFFGIMQDPNYLCFFFLMPVAFLLSLALSKNSVLPKKLFFYVALLFLLYGILRTGSRGGLISTVVVMVVYLCFFQKQKWKTVFLIILSAIIAIFLYNQLMNLLPEAIINRFTIENVLENGGSNRFMIWEKYCSQILTDPFTLLFGRGNGSGVYYFGYAAHNYLIESWFEYGIVGVVLLVLLFRSILKEARQNSNWIAYSTLWGIIILSMTLSVGKNLYFWLAVILVNIISKNQQEGIVFGYTKRDNFKTQ